MIRRSLDSLDVKDGGWLNVILILTTSVLLFFGSFYVYRYIHRTAEGQGRINFENKVEIYLEKMNDQSIILVNYLHDLRGRLMAGKMNQMSWMDYIGASGFEKRYPGYASFGYVEKVDKKDLTKFEQSLKNEAVTLSYNNYTVFPETANRDIYPVKYLYTFDKDLSSLLGYDFGSSESLAAAMLESSITGKEFISDRLFFEKVISGNNKTGYVILLPVYDNPGVLELNLDLRRSALIGFVGAFVEPKSFFLELTGDKDISFIVKDGESEVYKYQDINRSNDLKITKKIDILGKNFDLEFSGATTFLSPPFLNNLTNRTLVGLVSLNVLWYLTILGLVLARKRSQKITKMTTDDLRRFKQAVDGVSDLVIITDPTGIILYANDALIKTTGYSHKEILGQKPSLWGGQMDKDFYIDFWNTIKNEKKPFSGELKNRKKNGEQYEVELRIWPILNDAQNVIYYVGIERDITKTKAVEKMKTEFISLASHQLRTPLSAVKWFGKMLLDGEVGELSKSQKEYMDKIYESNEREIQLVNSLLSVSRIDSGKIRIEPKKTDIKALVETVIESVEIGVNKSKKKIKFTAEKEIPSIMVDPDLIRHAYLNILTNAVRYTKENGKIEVELSVSKNELISKISDNGIGIPTAEQDRLFDKFYRGTNALKKETDGNGLGLYLAKSVVESSGGKIWFKSKENVGTTFWFSLPIKSHTK